MIKGRETGKDSGGNDNKLRVREKKEQAGREGEEEADKESRRKED